MQKQIEKFDNYSKNERSLREEKKLKVLVQFALIAGPFLSMIDSSVVNVALPIISSDFHSSLASVQWILSGYLLSLAAIISVSAFLSKRLGALKVYFWSMIGFTSVSLFCAFSPSLNSLVVARIIQGALGAPLVPVSMDLLFGDTQATSGKSKETEQISPVVGMILFLAPALGPTLGGYLLGFTGWQSIFLINVPIGITSALLVWHHFKEIPQNKLDRTLRFDAIGSILLSLSLVLTTFGASEGPLFGWLSILALPPAVLGIFLLVAYVVRSWHRKNPAVNPKIMRHPQTALALSISVIADVVLFAVLFLIPVFMESFQGISSLHTGLALIPQGIVLGIGTVIGGKLPERIGIRLTVVLGMGILAASTLSLLILNVSTPVWVTAAILSGRGLALGLTIQPLLFATLGELSGSEVSDGNTLFSIMERLGGTLGISLLSSFLVVREEFHIDPILSKFGINTGTMNGSFGQSGTASLAAFLPSTIKSQLANAATSGFHDTVLLLTLASLGGTILALFIKNTPRKQIKENEEAAISLDTGRMKWSERKGKIL